MPVSFDDLVPARPASPNRKSAITFDDLVPTATGNPVSPDIGIPTSDFVAPEPPPGAVIHGGDGRSYMAAQPEISVERTAEPGTRDEAVQMQALAGRGSTDSVIGDIGRTLRPFTQGQSLNFGDEAVSKVFSGIEALRGGSAPDAYDYAQEVQRQEMARQTKEAPWSSLGLEIAGGLGTGLGLASKGATLLRPGLQAAEGPIGAILRTGAMGLEGGAYGAASAYGNDHDPITGALIGGAFGAGGNVVAESVGGIANAIAGRSAPRIAPPSLDDLRGAKNDAYDAVGQAGVTYAQPAFDSLIDDIVTSMAGQSINPLRHPKANSMVDELKGMRGRSPSLTELDQTRQVVRRDVADATDGSEALLGRNIIERIDQFIEGAGPPQMATGAGSDGAELISAARDANQRFRKVGDLDSAVQRAELRASSTGTGGNVDNATRQNLRGVFEDGKNWSPAEQAAYERAISGTWEQNALRKVGRLAPTGIVSSGLGTSMGAGAGAAVGGPVGAALGALALPAIGQGAKALADRATTQNVASLRDVLAGIQQPAQGDVLNPEILQSLIRAMAGAGAREATP